MNVQRNIGRFLRNTRGGVTAVAALAATLMTIGGGVLIGDHAWLVDQRDTLKSASDAAGIAATIEMARMLDRDPDISDADLKRELDKVAKRYIELNLSHLSAARFAQFQSTLVVDVVPNRSDRTVEVSAAADLGGFLLAKRLLGTELSGEEGMIPTVFTVRAEALSERVVNPVEVVLAIDISQSMERCVAGGGARCANDDNMRISIAKRAATQLVDILDPNPNDAVAIGVVPWHMTVRLDDSSIGEWETNGWTRYPESRHYSSIYSCGHTDPCPAPAADQNLPATPPEQWKGCLDEHRLPEVGSHASLAAADERLAPPAQRPFAQAFFPAPFGTAYECVAYPVPDFVLQSCYDTHRYDHPPPHLWKRDMQLVQSAQYGCDDTDPIIQPLTSDKATINAAIDRLDAVGKLTYSALGVLWGQRLLEHGWQSVWGDPVHPVDRSTNPEVRKALVLLTDGDDSYCDAGAGTKLSCQNSSAGVDRTEACAAAKAAGTEIFVIAAMHPSAVGSHLEDTLRACSSESENPDGTYVFLNNRNPRALEDAFTSIANQLSTIRRVY